MLNEPAVDGLFIDAHPKVMGLVDAPERNCSEKWRKFMRVTTHGGDKDFQFPKFCWLI